MLPRFRLLPTVLLVSSLAAVPVFAQTPAGPPPGGQAGGQGMRGPGGGRMMDPTLIDGPMMPEEFAALAALDSKQEGQYEKLYQDLMTSTKGDRQELKDARDKRRQQMAAGGGPGQVDRAAMQAERDRLRPKYQNLQNQQEKFESGLKSFLKPDQLKKYEDWKEEKREEMRAQFGGGRRQP